MRGAEVGGKGRQHGEEEQKSAHRIGRSYMY